MKLPLQITTLNIDHSAALDRRIRAKAERLEAFHPNITSCRITLEALNKHSQKGRQFAVRIDLRVPGKEIAVNREHDADVLVTLRDAFNSARRQLQDAAREIRQEVKVHALARHGQVARLNAEEGYGFIRTGDGRELYFSRENVVHPSFDHLEAGTAVQFIEEPAGEGAPAKRVSAGKHGA